MPFLAAVPREEWDDAFEDYHRDLARSMVMAWNFWGKTSLLILSTLILIIY
jgi:hypothetical protein